VKSKTKNQNLFSPLMQKTRVETPEGIQEREARVAPAQEGISRTQGRNLSGRGDVAVKMAFVWFLRALHLGFVLALVLGPLVPRWRIYIIAIAGGAIATQILFLGCPLVALESALLGSPAYPMNSGSFTCWVLYKAFGVRLPAWSITAMTVLLFLGTCVLIKSKATLP